MCICNGKAEGARGGEAISHLFQKLSVLLIKGNAALANNREPGQMQLVTMESSKFSFIVYDRYFTNNISNAELQIFSQVCSHINNVSV